MPNNRIFYACQAVQINGPSGSTGANANPLWDTVQGLQSVGMNTNFNLEPIYQMGQLELYDNYEEIPEVEITLNKVLDSSQTIYAMTMGTGSLVSLNDSRCGVRLLLYPDTNSQATGVPIAQVECVPAYLSSVTYTFPTEGNATEEVTLVSNDKVWATNLSSLSGSPEHATPGNVGIIRRGLVSKSLSSFPTGAGAGTNGSVSGGMPSDSKISNVTISMNLGREQIRELGSRTPFVRYINFPVEITCEIEITAHTGDMVGVAGSTNTACNNPKALTNKALKIALCDGTVIDLGSKNKLTSVNYSGGDTGGGNATITYSYQTYNDFTYTAPTGAAGDTLAYTEVTD
jgi:hypothetical protein